MGNKFLVLAEKPSVGRELGRVLGCKQREQGYVEGPEYVVTWALGHLIELAQPHDYNSRYRRWNLSDLPILPSELELNVSVQTEKQFHLIKSLMERPDIEGLIIATDAGREGELVARWIMQSAGWDKPAKRLWISSQTDEAITQGFLNLKDASVYDQLYQAAQARSAADWYVGLNVTRALTTFYDARLSAGRVQSPTLALMVEREKERQQFNGGFYWTIRVNMGLFNASLYHGQEVAKLASEQEAQDIATALEGAQALVTAVNSEQKQEAPPLLYDLTELQRDANRYYGYSAKQTLDILQKLYEVHKIVTYPRTDSRYITEDIVPTFVRRLKALEATRFGQVSAVYAEHGFRSELKRFVNEAKVTDHHALLPTETFVNLAKLSKEETHIWQLVALRFLEVLSGDYLYQSSSVELKVEPHLLISKTSEPIQHGWRALSRLIDLTETEDPLLASLSFSTTSVAVGEKLEIKRVRQRRNSTAVPPRYTEGTLLSAMEHAGRLVDDAALKKHLSGGLGTPATRADIIEKLIQNRYVERSGRELIPTAKGMELIRISPEQLCSAELTAEWENRLQAISEGKESAQRFLSDIQDNARSLVNEIKSSKERFTPNFEDGKKCPYCTFEMMKFTDEVGQTHFQCQRLSCSYEEMLIRRPLAPTISIKKERTPSAAGKRVVVIKKNKTAAAEFELEMRVVQPSRYKRAEPRATNQNRVGQNSEGTTFADLLAASEKRKKERAKKRS